MEKKRVSLNKLVGMDDNRRKGESNMKKQLLATAFAATLLLGTTSLQAQAKSFIDVPASQTQVSLAAMTTVRIGSTTL